MSKDERQSVSKALLQKIKTLCLRLKEFEIEFCDFKLIETNDLSQGLERIRLSRCEIPLNWFRSCKFNRLETLDMSYSSSVGHVHLKDLAECARHTLKRLILKGCYRVGDRAAQVLTTEDFTKLKTLDLENTYIEEKGALLILRHFKDQIEFFSLKSCKLLFKEDIDLINSILIEENYSMHVEI